MTNYPHLDIVLLFKNILYFPMRILSHKFLRLRRLRNEKNKKTWTDRKGKEARKRLGLTQQLVILKVLTGIGIVKKIVC